MARAPDVSVHGHFGTRQQNKQLERRIGGHASCNKNHLERIYVGMKLV